jgi:hypothetical protein
MMKHDIKNKWGQQFKSGESMTILFFVFMFGLPVLYCGDDYYHGLVTNLIKNVTNNR